MSDEFECSANLSLIAQDCDMVATSNRQATATLGAKQRQQAPSSSPQTQDFYNSADYHSSGQQLHDCYILLDPSHAHSASNTQIFQQQQQQNDQQHLTYHSNDTFKYNDNATTEQGDVGGSSLKAVASSQPNLHHSQRQRQQQSQQSQQQAHHKHATTSSHYSDDDFCAFYAGSTNNSNKLDFDCCNNSELLEAPGEAYLFESSQQHDVDSMSFEASQKQQQTTTPTSTVTTSSLHPSALSMHQGRQDHCQDRNDYEYSNCQQQQQHPHSSIHCNSQNQNQHQTCGDKYLHYNFDASHQRHFSGKHRDNGSEQLHFGGQHQPSQTACLAADQSELSYAAPHYGHNLQFGSQQQQNAANSMFGQSQHYGAYQSHSHSDSHNSPLQNSQQAASNFQDGKQMPAELTNLTASSLTQQRQHSTQQPATTTTTAETSEPSYNNANNETGDCHSFVYHSLYQMGTSTALLGESNEAADNLDYEFVPHHSAVQQQQQQYYDVHSQQPVYQTHCGSQNQVNCQQYSAVSRGPLIASLSLSSSLSTASSLASSPSSALSTASSRGSTTLSTTSSSALSLGASQDSQKSKSTASTTAGRQLVRSRRGRPRKKSMRSKSKVNGKLWEFIRDLLLSERTNPSFIRWERREDGVFKFVQSDKVAKMWGERKQNPKMTYEKLSRAMRYYYKSKVLLPVFGRRLVYKFGPNATGWLPIAVATNQTDASINTFVKQSTRNPLSVVPCI